MALDLNKFVTINKMPGLAALTDSQIVRVNEKTITLGKSLLDHAIKNDTKAERVLVQIQYSKEDNALRFVPVEHLSEGFVFSVSTNRNTAVLNSIPLSLKKMQILRGTYRLHPEHDDVYVLEDSSTVLPLTAEERYAHEEPEFEVGDIVSWTTELRTEHSAHGRLPVTGRIVHVEAEAVQIKPISKIWYEQGKSTSVTVNKRKLILREKHDA